VAPWYRWSHPGVPASGRGSRPVLQKYDGATLVAEFMQEPQRSLKFTSEDLVHEVRALDPLDPPTYLGKLRRLSALGYVPTTTRKLFLDTHKRFYLIVCELHCDMQGFPSVKRDEVCEAGFVIRRRIVPQLTPAVLAEVKPILQSLGTARRGLTQLATEQPQTQQLGKFSSHHAVIDATVGRHFPFPSSHRHGAAVIDVDGVEHQRRSPGRQRRARGEDANFALVRQGMQYRQGGGVIGGEADVGVEEDGNRSPTP
jgi:hypothetical protein